MNTTTVIDIFTSPLLGGVLGVFTVGLSFAIYLYKKHPSLVTKFSHSQSGLILTLRNKKDVSVNVSYIRLVKKNGSKPIVESNSFFYVVPSDKYDFQSTQDDNLEIEIKPNSSVKELHINYLNLKYLYDFFIPYERHGLPFKQLNRRTKMERCHIAIYLTSGRIQYIPLPLNFYDYYRDSIRMEFERDFLNFSGKGMVKIHFSTKEHERKYKEELLQKYEIACRNYYFLSK